MDAFYKENMTYENMSDRDLQLRLIFSVVVAGKNAKFASNVLENLFGNIQQLPFDLIQHWINQGILENELRLARTGNYTKFKKCFPELIKINPKTATLEELEAVPGIGPKTSRFYHIWIGKQTKCAALDTHVLKFLGDLGFKVPKATPTGQKYKDLETIFLNICEERHKTPNQLDSEVWQAYSSKDKHKIRNVLIGV
jgi:thermostable 8-oxoguanine DNA glycosylase